MRPYAMRHQFSTERAPALSFLVSGNGWPLSALLLPENRRQANGGWAA